MSSAGRLVARQPSNQATKTDRAGRTNSTQDRGIRPWVLLVFRSPWGRRHAGAQGTYLNSIVRAAVLPLLTLTFMTAATGCRRAERTTAARGRSTTVACLSLRSEYRFWARAGPRPLLRSSVTMPAQALAPRHARLTSTCAPRPRDATDTMDTLAE